MLQDVGCTSQPLKFNAAEPNPGEALFPCYLCLSVLSVNETGFYRPSLRLLLPTGYTKGKLQRSTNRQTMWAWLHHRNIDSHIKAEVPCKSSASSNEAADSRMSITSSAAFSSGSVVTGEGLQQPLGLARAHLGQSYFPQKQRHAVWEVYATTQVPAMVSVNIWRKGLVVNVNEGEAGTSKMSGGSVGLVFSDSSRITLLGSPGGTIFSVLFTDLGRATNANANAFL